jgi:chromosome segregation ATPase
MENLEELKNKVENEKAKLIVLAGQNTDYNKEIVRLKALKEAAEKDYASTSAELERVVSALTEKQKDFDILSDAIEKTKASLSYEMQERDGFFKNAEKEKLAIIDRISVLRVQREALENEIASLSTKSFNAGVTINTQNFTISENERRVNKSKIELSDIKRRVGVANIELRSVEDKIKEKSAELQAKGDVLAEKNNNLVSAIDENNKKLSSLRSSIMSEYAAFEADISEQNRALEGRKKSLTEAESKCKELSEINRKTSAALVDREQELKLLELKIKELARKRDIDAQIISLSK